MFKYKLQKEVRIIKNECPLLLNPLPQHEAIPFNIHFHHFFHYSYLLLGEYSIITLNHFQNNLCFLIFTTIFRALQCFLMKNFGQLKHFPQFHFEIIECYFIPNKHKQYSPLTVPIVPLSLIYCNESLTVSYNQ